MKLRDLTYLITADNYVHVSIWDEESNEDILYKGPWIKCNYMNAEVISISASRQGYLIIVCRNKKGIDMNNRPFNEDV